MTSKIRTGAALAFAAAMALGSVPAGAGVVGDTLDKAGDFIDATASTGETIGGGIGYGTGAVLGTAVGITGGTIGIATGSLVSAPAAVADGGNTFQQIGEASGNFASVISENGAIAGGEAGAFTGKAIAKVGATAVVGTGLVVGGAVVGTGLVVGGVVYAAYKTAYLTTGAAWEGIKGAGGLAKKIATAGN